MFTLSALALLVGTPDGRAQDCPTTLTPADAGDNTQFGASVAAHDGTAVIGSLEGNGTRAGSAYVVDLEAQTQRHKLVEPVSRDDSLFGWSVGIGATRVAVGAPHSVSTGTVYVFDAATGELIYTLQASDAANGNQFGYSVALRNDVLVVGAPRVGGVGAAYVFDLTTGAERLRLTPRKAPDGAAFGQSVSTDGIHVAVGTPSDQSTKKARSGAVYLFEAATGKLRRKVVPSDPGVPFGSRFGDAVALDRDRLLVGALLHDDPGVDSGAAYLFDVPSGREIRKLAPESLIEGDLFGLAVALHEDHAAVHALAPIRRQGAGLAYVFDARTGEPIATLPPRLRNAGDGFGTSLAIDEERLVAGVPRDDAQDRDAGAIELFRLDDLPGTPVVLDPEPTVTRVRYEFTLPGIGTFVFERNIVGRIVAEIPLDCQPPKTFRVTELELRPEEPEPPIELAPGVTITLNEPGIRLAEPGPTATVGPGGSVSQELQVQVVGSVQYTFPTGSGSIDMSSRDPRSFSFAGNVDTADGTLTLIVDLPQTTQVIDLGLGDMNPSFSVSGTLVAERVLPTFVAATPSQTLKARVDIDFARDAADRTKFSGVFDRARPPALGDGTTAVLRIGAFREDILLDAKGRTPKGSDVALKLKVKKRKATFKASVRNADLQAALAALPTSDGLPREIPWSLTLPDGWRIEGLLEMDGKDRLRRAGDGVITRAALSMKKRKLLR